MEPRKCGIQNCESIAQNFWKLHKDDHIAFILCRCESHPLQDDEVGESYFRIKITQEDFEVRLIMNQ